MAQTTSFHPSAKAQNTFRDNGLRINNPANTFRYVVTGGAISAERVLNVPVITGSDTLAVLGLAQTFTAAQTVGAALTIGSDGTGYDVTFYSGTAGDNFLWDASEEKLVITGTNGATAFAVADGNATFADDLTVTGATVLNGAVTLGSDGDDVITVNGTVAGANALVFEGADSGGANAHETTLFPIDPTADATIKLPAMGAGTYFLPVLDTVSTTAISATPEELNLLAGVSGLVQADLTKLAALNATAAELNLTDGDSSIGTTAVADGHGIVVNHAGTMAQTSATTFATYFAAEITAMPNLASVGAQTAAFTVGVDDTGYDVKFFGASAGAYMEWDESVDQLRIIGASADATTSTGKLLLATSLTDINANDVLGKIDFQAPLEAGGTDAITVAASIQAIAQGTFASDLNATDLIFYTGHTEAATEKFRFTSQGELGIGGANYGSDGEVLTSGGAGVAPAWEAALTGDITAVSLTGDSGGALSVASGAAGFTLTGGTGLTTVGSGTTVTLNVDAAQSGITSIYATDLILGEDSETAIDFGTANEIDFKINNTAELTLSATSLYPIADAGLDLGTTALGFNDLHLGSAGVLNFDNANMTITHSDTVLTVAGGTLATAALTTSTIVASGIIKTDATTAATTIADGSLQTDGGLSVTFDAVIGDDLILISDAAVLSLGIGADVKLTHDNATGGTLSGTPLVVDSLAASALADDTYTGVVLGFISNGSIAIGQAVYVHTADGRVAIADANALATMPAIGVAVTAASDGGAIKILTHGIYNDSDGFGGALTEGVTMYLGEDVGTVNATIPDAAGDFVQVMGIAVGPRDVFINPSLDIIERA